MKEKIYNKTLRERSRVKLCQKTVPHTYGKKFLVNDIISFDIFDTLILRPFDDPKSLFFLLGEKNKCPGFKRYRELAEKLARQEAFEKNGTYEVTLRDIYEKLSRFVLLDIDKAMQYEIETELDLCFVNPYMKEIFLQAKISERQLLPFRICIFQKMLLKNA